MAHKFLHAYSSSTNEHFDDVIMGSKKCPTKAIFTHTPESPTLKKFSENAQKTSKIPILPIFCN